MFPSDLILIATIPFTYALIGWFTNWLALKMTFYPIRFFGYPPYFGWQGIIPRKANKIAHNFVEVITEKLLDVKEIAKKIDDTIVEKKISNALEPTIQKATIDFANSIDPELWNKIPKNLQKEIIGKIKKESGVIIKKITREIQEDIHSKLNIKQLVFEKMTGENTKTIVEMFQRVGGPEFKFIERSGLYFGFLLGLFQLIVWFYFPIAWTLPLQGILVGYVTNFLAIQMIFRPLEPKKYFGIFEYQGLFLKRKDAVSLAFAKIVSEQILSSKNILEELLFGKAAEILLADIQKEIFIQIDKITTFTKPLIAVSGKWATYEISKLDISKTITEATILHAKGLDDYLHSCMALDTIITNKMKVMSAKEFESILRSAFQEDELLLILIGAALGAFVGFLQLVLVSV
ncbi:DUF445 domain-containing protein [Leptospira jelokensis]|uniref:DUF445 domain-containing protein n=1 Tax=Leptospira jelokensis TaxID=2484931 RepID=UPI001090F6B2|nr:DUF445 family protein [Leptospira jelokensis]TGM05360.1 DUF445 family protein [Leptospira jelokensis]